MSNFETWWEREGQEFLFAINTTRDDIKLVAEVAWKNGAYCAEQAKQEPVDGVLPCPFCGDNKPTVFEGSTFRWRVAVCNNCGAYAPEVRHDTLAEDQKHAGIKSDDAAITAWNTRAAPVRTKDLTDDELDQAAGPFPKKYKNDFYYFARAVIAADREKNK